MRIIITENKLDNVVFKWLKDNYGNLKPFRTKKYPGHTFYIQGNEVIFDYQKDFNGIEINYGEIFRFLEGYLRMEPIKIKELVKVWFKDSYGLPIDEVGVSLEMGVEYNDVVEEYKLRLNDNKPTLSSRFKFW
jgi:hypothetical protein